MTGGSTFQDFFTQTMGEFGTVPKRGLIYVTIAGVLSAITDLFHWGSGAKFSDFDYALLGIVTLPWLAAAYATTMTMVERPSSMVGFIKFTAVTILTFVPILSSLAVLIHASRAGLHDGLTVSTVIALLLIGLLLVVPARLADSAGDFYAVRKPDADRQGNKGLSLVTDIGVLCGQ